jgi:hypothetical protein
MLAVSLDGYAASPAAVCAAEPVRRHYTLAFLPRTKCSTSGMIPITSTM